MEIEIDNGEKNAVTVKRSTILYYMRTLECQKEITAICLHISKYFYRLYKVFQY